MKALKGSELKAIKGSQKKNLLNDRSADQADSACYSFWLFHDKMSDGVKLWLKDQKILFRNGNGKKRSNRNKEIRNLAAWMLRRPRRNFNRSTVMKILISPGLGPVHNPSLSNGNGFRSGKPSRLHSHLILGPFYI